MRASGILMHITSLPGNYGVGTMGQQAYSFIDFLKRAGQRYWQILPLNPTGYGDSPYQSCSAFAGNPYLVDLSILQEEGLLRPEEVKNIQWSETADRVDFGRLYENRANVLRIAFDRFSDHAALDAFCRENDWWLADFALYMAIKEANGGKAWYQWDIPLMRRNPDALGTARGELTQEIRYHCFVQYLFDRQWSALRRHAREKGIAFIGDVPIYVPYDSADVWSHPELFCLDDQLQPEAVAGCPPDAFSQDGQLWGNPLYNWDRLKEDGYRWWVQRIEAATKRYDVVRIDHFRGLESYWAVPHGEKTARNGKWLPGPGMDLIRAIRQALPRAELIAEDLGFLTPQVLQFREESGFPGMKVLQFAFGSEDDSAYLPHRHTENSVCYTGTHDNMTMAQWFASADAAAVEHAVSYMQLTQEEGYVWGTIRTAMASVSKLCMIPMQDYLQLGEQARMNFPGTQMAANWTWRAEEGFACDALADKIYQMTKLYARLGAESRS